MQPEQLTVNEVIKQLQVYADKFGGDSVCKAFLASNGSCSPNYPIVGVGLGCSAETGKRTEILLAVGVS